MPVAQWAGCEDRLAWLLRANRLYGPDERLAVGSNFVKAFRGGGFRRAIDGAQLTRWEKAAQRVDYPVLRRYEQLLDLPAHRLVAVADALYRTTRGRPGRPSIDRQLDGESPRLHERTERLIDRASGSDLMSGTDWDELTASLWAMPSVFLYPSTLWNDLIDRLLAEMIIADGLGWLQRSEALHRLLGHPIGEPIVVAACAALVADPDNQVFVDPLTSMEASAHPDTVRKLIGQIVNPTNEHAFRGAWWSVAEKVRRGHFAPDELAMLGRHAIELLATEQQHPACRLAAAELLRHTGSRGSGPLTRALQRVTSSDRVSRQVLRTGRVAAGEVAVAFTGRVALHAASMLPRDVRGDDPMLRLLIDEMLFQSRLSTRFTATQLIEATPYRVPVAHALTQELGNRTVLEDPVLAPAVVNAVSLLGDARSFRFLQRLVLTTGVPRFVAESALWVLGHARERGDDAFWAKAIARHRGHPASIRGVVYGLGLTRNMPLLRRCRADPAMPTAARRAAAWWLNIPARILNSTLKSRA